MDKTPVTTEEPAASKDSEVKDEKAGTPVSTDEKAAGEPEKTAPKKDESAEPASVTNGTTEPAKEESTPAQKTSEKVTEETAESNKADVEPAKTATEETPKEETRAEPVVVPKQKGPEEPPAMKIEVKDDVKTEVEITHKDESSALNEQEIEKTKDIKNEGDSDTAQNLPPPPLPCNPPPSQVMVFALSDIKSSEQEQQIPTTLTDVPPQEVSNKPSEAKEAPPPQGQEGEQLSEKATVGVDDKTAPAQESSPAEQVPQPDLSKEASKTDDQKPLEVSTEKVIVKETSDNQLSEVPKPQDSTAAESVSPAPEAAAPEQPKEPPKSEGEPASQEQKIIEKVLSTTDKPDVEINPEQIAETIALIDEVTKEAAEITQQKLESQTTSPTDTPSTEQTSLEQKEVLAETSCNAPHPDDSLSKVPETTSTESQIPPVESKPVEAVKEEKQAETTTAAPSKVESGKAQKETETTEKSKTDTPVQLGESATGVEKKAEEAPKTNIEQSDSETKKDAPPTETAKKDEIVAEGNAPANVEGSTASNESVTSAKSKENGVEDTHEPVTETSATESLSGQVEHKIIEEVKGEQQQIEKKPDATAEGAAVQVATE